MPQVVVLHHCFTGKGVRNPFVCETIKMYEFCQHDYVLEFHNEHTPCGMFSTTTFRYARNASVCMYITEQTIVFQYMCCLLIARRRYCVLMPANVQCPAAYMPRKYNNAARNHHGLGKMLKNVF